MSEVSEKGNTAATIRDTLVVDSDLAEAARARKWVADLGRRTGLSSKESHELKLAVTEACTNAIKHAYSLERGRTVELRAQIDSRQIRLVIRDFGKKPDLSRYEEPDLDSPPESGYGILLLRRLMDEVHFN